jgi:alpha-L-rhamnosidase
MLAFNMGTRRTTTTFGVAAWTAVSIVVGSLFAATAESDVDNGLTVSRLRCEYLVDPAGIDASAPELSWVVASPRRGAMQSAYQIVVASSPPKLDAGEGDLWDSGRVESGETFGIRYTGRPLKSRERCYWRVRTWDDQGQPSPWSMPATWSAGLLDKNDWKGKWIGGATANVVDPPADLDGADWIWTAEDDRAPGERVFYKKWSLPTGVAIKSAWLTAVGGEITSFYINGHEVIQTMHRSEPMHVDVRSQLKPGENLFSMMVRQGEDGPVGGCAKLVITPETGSPIVLTTDGRWRIASEQKATDANLGKRGNDKPIWVAGRYGGEPWGIQRAQRLATEPPHYLREDFSVNGDVKRAILSVTALGWADVYLNGQRVSDDLFGSGWTEYKKRVYYRTYDVTSLLRQGENGWGAILADGWYSGHIGWNGIRAHWGKHPRLLAQIDIEYADGSVETIATNDQWRRSLGPTTVADILMGEEYDARRQLGDWSEPGYDASVWQPVAVGAEMNPVVEPHPAPPVVVFDEWQAKSITEPKPGVYVFDFGQNFAGVCRLKIRGQAGQTIQLRFAERLNDDGTLYTTNLRTAQATDRFTCKDDKEIEWQPRQTFHGFQYAEVTGLTEPPTKDLLTAVAITADIPQVGEFSSSDPLLNQLISNILWTQRANFIEVPTDCPQRDERLGWTGDAQFYVNAACLNADVQSFFRKWLVDVTDAQREDGQFPRVAPTCVTEADGGPAYADAGVICPWTMYEVYGDKTLLERQYPSMKRFIEFCKSRSRPGGLPPKEFHCFGDWLNVEDDTPKELIYTAYFGLSAHLTAQAARELGYTSDAEEMDQLFAEIQKGFTAEFVDADGRIKCNSQCAYALALAFDLVPDKLRPLVAKRLLQRIEDRDGHLSTGFVGTRDLTTALAQVGRNDVAYRLLQKTSYPGWLFSVRQGATTIWEHWDGWTPDKGFEDAHMNSFAHYSFGSVYAWMVENIGGIQRGAPAYKQIVIAPQPGGSLTSARTRYDSIRGPIETDWNIADGRMKLSMTTPANTKTTVRLPTQDADSVRIDHQSLADLGIEPRTSPQSVEFDVPSGKYDFEFPVAFKPTSTDPIRSE